MDIKVRTNISNEFDSIEVIVNAPKLNNDVQDIVNNLLNTSNEITEVSAIRDNEIFIIKISDIIMFYSEDKDILCKTNEGIFKVKEKLYQLEDNLPQNSFIRISNSAIINVDHVKCFDVSILGQIIVKFKNNTYEYVSKRRVSEVMKFLKNRRR